MTRPISPPPLDSFESTWHRATLGVVSDVLVERATMLSRWGDPSYPSVAGLSYSVEARVGLYDLPTPEKARAETEGLRGSGDLDWATISVQSLSDAVSASDETARRIEVVQLAAVALAWVEDIDRQRRAAEAAKATSPKTERGEGRG